MASSVIDKVVSYGLQNKKSKQDILSALLKTGQADVSTSLKAIKDLSDYGAFDYTDTGAPSKTDLSSASATERQGIADIDSTMQMASEAKQMISGISTGPIAGRIQGAQQMLPSGGDKSFNQLDAKLSNIKSNFMKALSGAAVSEQEVARLSKFLPSTTDQEEVIKIKLDALENELSNRKKNTLKSLGIDVPEEADKPQPGFVEAVDFARQNPSDPNSQKLIQALRSGQIDPVTGAKKGGVDSQTNTEQKSLTPQDKADRIVQANTSTEQFKQEANYANSFKGFMSNFADALGENTGMKKFAQGIGATIFLNSNQGKELQDKAARGDGYALEALQGILSEAPESKEVIGSAAMTALNALSGGLASKGASFVAGESPAILSTGEKALNLAKNIGKGAGTGYGYDIASDLEQNKGVGEVLTPGLGTFVGASAPSVMAVNTAMKARKALSLSEDANRAIGQIVQGTKEDIAPAIETFKRIERKGVKTYEDLSGKISDNNKALGQAMDEVLAKDQTARKLEELVTATDVGGKKVETNFVKQALDDLTELYTKTNSPTEAQRVKNLSDKANSEGLTVADINNIAKEYGGEFGNKAFSKRSGEALTSVNAGAYENTRKGVKNTLRNLLPDETAKSIDKAFTENINTKRLIDDMAKKVNTLEQKVNQRSLLQKGGRAIGQIADVATGGIVKSFFTKFLVESNLGLKSMNSLDLQGALSKNIKKIDAVLKSEPGKIEQNTIKLIQDLTKEYSGKDAINYIKGKGGLSIQDVSGGKAGYADDLISEAKKYPTPEEFVKAQVNAYHQSQSKTPFSEFVQKGEKGYKKASYSQANEGIYFSPNKELVQSKYGKDGGVLVEAAVVPKKSLDLGDLDAMYFDGRKVNYSDIVTENFKREMQGLKPLPEPDIILTGISKKAKEWLTKNGYDAVEGMKGEMWSSPEIVALDKSVIKTKSQLTDLWKQARGGKVGEMSGMKRINELAKNIDQADVKVMADFLDVVEKLESYPKSKVNDIKLKAQILAEQMNIKEAFRGDKTIARVFKAVLDRSRL